MKGTQGGYDLTQGSMLGHVISFSIPMLLGNMLQALYNTVDSIWVGRFLGPEALGAVSVSFPIIFVLISLVMGITIGSTVLIAQYTGAKQTKMVKRVINNTLVLLMAAALVATVLGITFNKHILRLINTPDEIMAMAAEYLNIFLLGLIFMFGYNAVSAILRGLGDSRTPLLFLAISTVINIVLDPLLILGVGPFPRMGIAGAALATTVAQGISFFIAVFYLNSRDHLLSINLKGFVFDREITAKTVKIGIPSGIQMSVVSVGMLVVSSLINSFGTEVVAIFGMTSRLDQFAIMPSQSISMATSAIAGQNIGAGNEQNVREAVKWSTILAVGISVVLTLVAQLTPGAVLALFTTDKVLLEQAGRVLRILSLSYVFSAVMFVTNGFLRGAGDTMATMIFSITSLWIIRLPLAAFLSGVAGFGANGIWIAIVLSTVFSMLMSRVYYASGRWKKKKIIDQSDDSIQPEA
ncbi:MAG: MATE family efflux transporter [Clostridia bacterium]|jgi:putative MATE family efflux protein|nr:MATE family efflux transporter [Clostridiales bacterium]